jgi:F0F1-type ATP synthase membrane subunit c/vacuolar-type H+-ATPase subunit K
MESARKTVQMIRIALLVSIALYVFIGERVGQSVAAPNRNLYFILTLVAITTVGMIFAVWRLFVLRSEAALAAQPEDPAALNRWRSGYIITYALTEAVAMFGLVLRILGFTLSEVAPFYLVGVALMLLFGPRRPSGGIPQI